MKIKNLLNKYRRLGTDNTDNGFCNVQLFGDCRVETKTIKDKIVSIIKTIAVKLHLIPKTMKGKELLKRIFWGRLSPLPPEIKDGMAEYTPPVPISFDSPNLDFKVLYAVGHVLKTGR